MSDYDEILIDINSNWFCKFLLIYWFISFQLEIFLILCFLKATPKKTLRIILIKYVKLNELPLYRNLILPNLLLKVNN